VHGKIGCITCHGGDGSATEMDAAHRNIVKDPTKQPEQVCGQCHADQVKNAATSLHANQTGYQTYFKTVGVDPNDPKVQEGFQTNCASCHTSCAQCHVSRPAYTGGGLLAGHTFKKVASLRDTCMACHGARVGDEYQGNYEGIEGDLHWNKLGMPCIECHKSDALHGDGQVRANMHENVTTRCTDCHTQDDLAKQPQHTLHGDKVSCYVCHSAGEYKNCANCHVGKDDKGLPWRTLDPSWMDFKIGRNPNKTADNPYEYVLVRHVPTNTDLFKAYGVEFQANAVPSWQPATPHNIQRKTTQNADCTACHGNAKLFLTEDQVLPEERQANQDVIVKELPQMSK
jgi:hypothetical protein